MNVHTGHSLYVTHAEVLVYRFVIKYTSGDLPVISHQARL
jgi:hypothetical protein